MIQHSETLHHLTPASQAYTEVLKDFDPISLEEMDTVKMLNRFDSKFILNKDILKKVLEAVSHDYFVLETAGTRVQSYNTIYFDTPDDRFYMEHHNGRSTRMKLRKREYVDSGIVFLEIKKKDNKGLTSKERMEVPCLENGLSEAETHFVKSHAKLNGVKLESKFGSRFKRITLVSKNFDERCTIDIELHFHSYSADKSDMNELVVAELKQERQYLRSKLAQVFKEYKAPRQPFSKYCFGRAINEIDLKSNVFKSGIRQIKNQINFLDKNTESKE